MRNELTNLQIIRGFAAVFVVMNHFYGGIYRGYLSVIGGFGVDIFFVLSGFIMVYTQNGKSPLTFIRNRIQRIYPIYIVVSLPLIAFIIGFDNLNYFLGNIFLSPSFGDKDYFIANDPCWTLVYEMVFYLMFSLSLLVSRDKFFSCLLVVALICSSVIITRYLGVGPRYHWINITYILGDGLLLDFAMGCALALVYDRIKERILFNFYFFLLSATLVFYVAIFVLDGDRIFRFGIPALVIVSIGVLCNTHQSWLSSFLSLLGDASYSIYLTHIYFVYAFREVMSFQRWGGDQKFFISTSFIFISIIAGIYVYKYVEFNIIKSIKQRRLSSLSETSPI